MKLLCVCIYICIILFIYIQVKESKRTHRFSVTLSLAPTMTRQTIHHISILKNKIALIVQLSWLTYCLNLKPT